MLNLKMSSLRYFAFDSERIQMILMTLVLFFHLLLFINFKLLPEVIELKFPTAIRIMK